MVIIVDGEEGLKETRRREDEDKEEEDEKGRS